MPFDPEQTEAINAIHTNVIVRASAGAGKTGVLVARLVKRCVTDGVPVSRILAVTFTEAAASEMRKRLAKSLHENCESEQDPEKKQYLMDQLAGLSSAWITTIDSFCLTIIKKYCNVIGLDPALARTILSEGEQENLRQEAFDMVLQETSRTDHEALLELLQLLSPSPQDFDCLYDTIKKINACADAAVDSGSWYAHAKESYAKVGSFAEFPENIRQRYLNGFGVFLQRVISDLDVMLNTYSESQKIKPDLIIAKKNAALSCMEEIQAGNYSGFCQRLDHLAEMKTTADSKAEAYTAARKDAEDIIKKMLGDRYDEGMLVRDNNELDAPCRLLVWMAEQVSLTFRKLKQNKACMDFSDMERYALEILDANDGECASILRNGLDEIMIDEFQDTSELQNEIIERIAKPGNVFRVGDVKQSIYRFRQAKPQLMRRLMGDPSTKVITLRHNYRSKESIVAFTNMLFGNLMNVPGARDVYLEEDNVTIGSDRQKEDAPVPVEFALLAKEDSDSGDDEPQAKEEESTDAKQMKAMWIANRIVTLMDQDPSLSYRSFAVLVKGHADKIYLRYAFDACGIPYDIDAREGFYQSQLCQCVLAMCRFMMDPNDAVSLACVLTSSFFGCSDDDLALMKKTGGTVIKGCEIMRPDVFREIDELHSIINKDGVLAFLSEMARRHDFLERLEEREKANFDYLFEIATQRGMDTLPGFTDMISDSEDERSSEAMSAGKDDDVVIVTTIHHSKGLQYPYVFLWGTSRNMFMDNKDSVVVDDELYIGLPHEDMPYRISRQTMRRKDILNKQDMEDCEEFIRLIYVAVTRAEKRLFIVDCVKDDQKLPEYGPLTLSDLQKRQGITGLLLKGAQEGPYFHVYHAYPAPPLQARRRNITYLDQLIQYTGLHPVKVNQMTPSSTEVTSLPDLDPAVENAAAMSYGTRMHAAVEHLPDTVWTEADVEATGLSRGDQKRLLAFGSSDLYRKCLALGGVHKEYPFWISKDDVHMNGQIDFCAIGRDKVILVDFKTDNAEPEEIKRRYSTQLNAYRLALHVMTGKPVEAYAWSFHNSCAIEIKE